MSTKWTVPRDWEGETAAVLASGPSMSAEVAETVRGKCRVIAVSNQAIAHEANGVKYPALAPWADVLYSADSKWWLHHAKEALAFKGHKVTIRNALPIDEVMYLEYSSKIPFDPSPSHLVSGGNSGYQAVHLAAHFGVSRILMCGFDMKEVNRKKHWFGDHPQRLNTAQNYRRWIANFEALYRALSERGIEVINCTHGSALAFIPYVPLSEAINGSR